MTIKEPIKSTIKANFNKKKLTDNIGLKIVALVVAILLWYIVVNITDPTISQTYKNVHVKILNAEVITGQGNTLQVVDNTAVIPSVIIKAPRTTIQELGSNVDNIIATADMSKLLSDGVSVPIECTVSKYSERVESIRPSIDYVQVSIEKRKTIQLPLSVTTSGEVESGYIVGDRTSNQNQVRVSGPQSVVERVKAAFVDVDVSGFTGNISTSADVELFDENGEPVPMDSLELNVSSIMVNVEILATKKVPIYYSLIGMPADGYGVTGEIECTPEVVTIAGEKSKIDVISAVKIPGEELNVTGQTDNLVTIVDIQDYLPQGIRLADSSAFSGQVTLEAFIEPYIESSVTVNTKDIVFKGVPFGFYAEMADYLEKAEIKITGLKQDIEKLDQSSVVGVIDFDDYALLNNISEYQEGVYNCVLTLELPEGIRSSDSVLIQVRLRKNEE
ncbi:MAG: hypothetical protein J5626_07300 [Lachnospiraceae bacterium]|nr:hypothetical protein [Lachnospiraceae bacterium]